VTQLGAVRRIDDTEVAAMPQSDSNDTDTVVMIVRSSSSSSSSNSNCSGTCDDSATIAIATDEDDWTLL
jgi:hypothetical protein